MVQFLFANPLSTEEVVAAIRRDRTVTDAVRQQALALVEPYGRSQNRNEADGPASGCSEIQLSDSSARRRELTNRENG